MGAHAIHLPQELPSLALCLKADAGRGRVVVRREATEGPKRGLVDIMDIMDAYPGVERSIRANKVDIMDAYRPIHRNSRPQGSI